MSIRPRFIVALVAAVGALALTAHSHEVSQADTPAAPHERPGEQRVFELINQYRASLKLPQLRLVDELVREAQWYASDMARNDSFSHTHIDSQGRPIEQRFHDFNYLWQRPLAQASSTGAMTPDAAFQQFKDSAAHDAIMRDARMRAIGVGTDSAPDTAAQTFWVASFGPSTDPRGAVAQTTASSVKKPKSKKGSAKRKPSTKPR